MGTAAGHAVGGGLLLLCLAWGRSGLKLNFSQMWIESEMSGRLLRIGVPGGIDTMLILSCHLWFVALINGLGNQQAAAHSLAIRIESLAYLPGTAFQVAATTLAGQSLGARDPRRASYNIWTSLAIATLVLVAAAMMFYFQGTNLAMFFTGGQNEATANQAAKLLRIASFAMPSLAATMILSGALRGAADTRCTMLINVFGMLGVRIPLTWLVIGPWSGIVFTSSATGSNAMLVGAWWAMFADLTVRAILLTARTLQGGWKHQPV